MVKEEVVVECTFVVTKDYETIYLLCLRVYVCVCVWICLLGKRILQRVSFKDRHIDNNTNNNNNNNKTNNSNNNKQ